MKLHEIKIKAEYYERVTSPHKHSRKTFEIRKNDRDYQEGDLVKFIVINDGTKDERAINIYNSNPILFKITYVLKDIPAYGLQEGYCIFSITPVKIQDYFTDEQR